MQTGYQLARWRTGPLLQFARKIGKYLRFDKGGGKKSVGHDTAASFGASQD
jgi:hypothetical protein